MLDTTAEHTQAVRSIEPPEEARRVVAPRPKAKLPVLKKALNSKE